MNTPGDRFDIIVRLAESDQRVPENVRAAIGAFHSADAKFNDWALRAKRGESSGNLEDMVFPVLDQDDEVIRCWDAFDIAPTLATAAALGRAFEASAAIRLRFVR